MHANLVRASRLQGQAHECGSRCAIGAVSELLEHFVVRHGLLAALHHRERTHGSRRCAADGGIHHAMRRLRYALAHGKVFALEAARVHLRYEALLHVAVFGEDHQTARADVEAVHCMQVDGLVLLHEIAHDVVAQRVGPMRGARMHHGACGLVHYEQVLVFVSYVERALFGGDAGLMGLEPVVHYDAHDLTGSHRHVATRKGAVQVNGALNILRMSEIPLADVQARLKQMPYGTSCIGELGGILNLSHANLLLLSRLFLCGAGKDVSVNGTGDVMPHAENRARNSG